MAVFLITYDTHLKRNYEDLYRAFAEYSVRRVLESVWVGELNNTPAEVRDWVKGLLDDDDSILVIEMKPRHAKAWSALPDDVVEWIKAKV